METAGNTDRGKMRSKNEDDFLIREKPYCILAVADGMGGHSAGDVASSKVIETAEEYKFDSDYCSEEQMRELVECANEKVIKLGEEKPAYRGMGTTFSAGAVHKGTFYYGHVGDSRIYLHRDDELSKISRDHSLVARMIEEGRLTSEEAFQHPRSNVLTQAIGLESELDIDSGQLDMKKGDMLIFCTDGLTDMIREKEIEKIASEHHSPEKLCKTLLEAALQAGGRDNITVVTGLFS